MKGKKKKQAKISKFNVAIVVAIAALAVVIAWQGMPAEKGFVLNQTFEKTSDIFYDYETTRYPSNVEIIAPEGENITVGIVTDQWNLNFGILPTGGSHGTRHVTVSNMEDRKVKASIRALGDISSLLSFSKTSLTLNPGESVSLDVFLNTTMSTATGKYAGEIDVIIQQPKFGFLYSFW